MSRLVLSSIRSQRSAVPNYRGGCGYIELSALACLVSIHVPLAEHDRFQMPSRSLRGRFNSRAPRGARHIARRSGRIGVQFQFTCPSRSTTVSSASASLSCSVSIHVPLAEHDPVRRRCSAGKRVSIHVPLAEHDEPLCYS